MISLYRLGAPNLQILGIPFTPFVKLFLKGNSHVPSWTQFHAKWHSLATKYPDQVLVLVFEKALADPSGTITFIAYFLGVDCSDEVMDKCLTYSSFELMNKKSKAAKAKHEYVGTVGGMARMYDERNGGGVY